MASNALAAMLDELMGRDRNLAPTEKKCELHWDDAEVCKHFLCGFCPHELFVNTRADLGPCFKIHDDALRKEYEKSSRYRKMGYEEDFLRYLQGLISDCEKRIRRGHQRLALNNQQGSLTNANSLPDGKEERIKMLTERINDLVQQAEELGCEGKVEESQGVMKLCDQLREERTQLETNVPYVSTLQPKEMEVCTVCGSLLIVGDMQQRLDEHMMGKQHAGYARVRATVEKMIQNTNQLATEFVKTMEVCTVCGALLVVNDVQQRIEEHLMGKQHSGWARIRAYVDSRVQERQKSDEEREAKLLKEREEREKEREKEREERRRKEKEKEREREKEKEREREKDRDREKRRRSRSRSRDRDRDRDRDRRRRSRSSSRRRRRSRSRSRDRHRSRRHRSRSRSRSRSKRSSKSRDRDRRRSRSRDRSSKNKSSRSSREKKYDDDESRDKDSRSSQPREDEAQNNSHTDKESDETSQTRENIADGKMDDGDTNN